MHPYQNLVIRLDVSLDQREMVKRIYIVLIGNGSEQATIFRRDFCFGYPADQTFFVKPVFDEIGNRDNLQTMPFGKDPELRHSGTRSILVHDLTDYPG